jgi:hypothetical protein
MDIKEHTTQALAVVVEKLPIGTNLALYQFLWMLVSGALHDSRGALFPALQAIGLSDAEVRRAWAALRYGAWSIEDMLPVWYAYVTGQEHWQPQQYAGYYVKAVDITAFWRPTLHGIQSQHYDAQADRALPAVVFGLVGRVGRCGEQRQALLTNLLRADLADPSEATLHTQLLKQVVAELTPDEMPVFDAGFTLRALHAAAVPRFVVRLPKNFTARRNFLPEYAGGRPAEYGALVRPVARTYKDKRIAATPPDRSETWQHQGLELRAEFWDDVVLPDCKPAPDNPTFIVAVLTDPRFEEPWVLACPHKLSGADFRGFYHARWPIEQLPLAAKHMVGANRQFVFAAESCYRLPELALLAGSILTYLAATLPPIPTGFWDRQPQATPGRLRRWLARTRFADLPPLRQERIRKKVAVTEHLPKGVRGHRRVKQPALA